MPYLTSETEYREALEAEYQTQESPATGAEERPASRLGDLPGVPPVENPPTGPQTVAMFTKRRAALTLPERIEIQAGLRAGDTQARLAAQLGRSEGCISGEVARNGGRAAYRAVTADRDARERRGAARRGHFHIAEHPPLRAEVHARLRRGWSPEEVAGTLQREHPDLPAMHTSHESIYRYVYVVAGGALKRELAACLRRHHTTRRPRRRGTASTQGKLKDMVLIDRNVDLLHVFEVHKNMVERGSDFVDGGHGDHREDRRPSIAHPLKGSKVIGGEKQPAPTTARGHNKE